MLLYCLKFILIVNDVDIDLLFVIVSDLSKVYIKLICYLLLGLMFEIFLFDLICMFEFIVLFNG